MVKPSMSHEASYALGQAAWVWFAQKHGKAEYDRLAKEYDAVH